MNSPASGHVREWCSCGAAAARVLCASQIAKCIVGGLIERSVCDRLANWLLALGLRAAPRTLSLIKAHAARTFFGAVAAPLFAATAARGAKAPIH